MVSTGDPRCFAKWPAKFMFFLSQFLVIKQQRRGCTKGCFLVPAKPIHILCVISFSNCPFVIEKLALTGLRFGTFGALRWFG